MLDYWERKKRLHEKSSAEKNKNTEANGEQIHLASVINESIVDGPGMRFVLFTQGCPHRCPGCHNPQTHLSVGGTFMAIDTILDRYQAHPSCRGITLSGGEPFIQAGTLAKIARAIHEIQGDVITYTGYRLEHLQQLAKTNADILALLNETDLLIDGPYVEAKRSLEVPFVGSLNQRLIALSPLGNNLLNDIPILPDSPVIERVTYQ